MANLIHIGEVAALLFVAYQLAWFVGFILRRASSRPAKSAAVAPGEPAAAKAVSEPPIRVPVIEPIAAVPAAPSANAATVAVEALLAKVDAPPTTLMPELPPPAPGGSMDVTPPAVPVTADADVAPPPIPTAPEADVSPPVPLNEEFLAELQSAMLAEDPPEEPEPVDPRAAAALTAAFEEAFELTPVPEIELAPAPVESPAVPEPLTSTDDQPGLFDPPVSDSEPEPPPTVVAAPPPQPVEPPPAAAPAPALAKDAMPIAPMAPATEPATVATNARPRPAPSPAVEIAPTPEPEPAAPVADGPPPILKPASKPGEVWSGRATKPPADRAQRPGILRPAGAPRAPSPGFPAARPAAPSPASRPANEIAATARDAVAAAAAKVEEVVAAAADYDDGIEASDEDAEAAAMRAIESGWMRKATPRTSRPERPEGVPPAKPKAS